jgi:hypothetical protein
MNYGLWETERKLWIVMASPETAMLMGVVVLLGGSMVAPFPSLVLGEPRSFGSGNSGASVSLAPWRHCLGIRCSGVW